MKRSLVAAAVAVTLGSLVAAFLGFRPSDAYFDAAPAANEAPKVEF